MGLQYALYRNDLNPDDQNYHARIQNQKTMQFDDIIADMTRRGLTLTDTEVLSVFNELTQTVNRMLNEGYAISTPLVKIRPGIVGKFKNDEDLFDEKRHAVHLTTSLGSELKIDYKKLKPKKVRAINKNPELMALLDYQSNTENELLTKRGAAELIGERLKIDTQDLTQGIFIIGKDAEVRVTTYLFNKPSRIVFNIPEDLPSGEVSIELRNTRKNSTVKCSGTLDTDLTVI